MASEREVYAKTYKPGDVCEGSGIYRIVHDQDHVDEHEVTVIEGKRFPPCRQCGKHPRFKTVRLALHIDRHDLFDRT